MSRVLIAIGSNSRPEVYMTWAAQRLSTMLTDIRLSRCLWAQDYHGSMSWYQNRLVVGTTFMSETMLVETLKNIEVESGRRKGHVTIDLDLMLYDDTRYHQDDWSRPYIQQLLHDVL